MCSEPAICVQDAVVRHRRHYSLRGASLRVETGEFVGVIGPNGAGKTTLLGVINGLRRLRSGCVEVLGMVPHEGDMHRVRQRVGLVAQVERLDPRLPLTVRETVCAGCYGRLGLFRRPTSADANRVEEALMAVGMCGLASRPVGQLSGGEYQRAAIARVLVQNPDVFLFDEPTASIDPRAQREILDLVQNLVRDTGKTALYVTHDLDTLPESCQRVVLMRDGMVWREGPRAILLDDAVLRDLYASEMRGAERVL